MFKPLSLTFTTVGAHAAESGLTQRRLDPPTRVDTTGRHWWPEADARDYLPGPDSYEFPALTRTELSDVVVRGGSNMLTTTTAILRHDLIDAHRDGIPEQIFGRLGYTADRRRAAWADYDPFDVHYVPEAAAFTDHTAENYAHWLTEVLPRVAAFVADDKVARTPLLLDRALHENLLRTLRLIAGDWPVYRIARMHQARVGRLHHVSVAGYVPYQLTEGQAVEEIDHGRFSPLALQRMVRMLRDAVAPVPSGRRPRLFVRRSSKARRLVNEAEIEAALVARGFEVIEPERLSFDEQLAAFSDAGMVAGATGAAMANLVFCRPDCPILVLMPRFRHLPNWYWRNVAAAAGAGPVVHVSGPQVETLPDPWDKRAAHQDYRVEVHDVLDGMDQALALTA